MKWPDQYGGPMMTCALAILGVLVQAAGESPKRREETATKSGHAYVVVQGGTVDGRTFRGPAGVYDAWDQAWESNRALRMENTGEDNVVNPWVSNGRNTFRTVQEIIASAVQPGMSDREKALALYDQQIRHRWHWGGDNDELGDPVKVFNVYGHNTCGNDSICLAGVWRRSGLKVTPACAVGHCISQVWFDGRWNLLDGDQQGHYLQRDGRTVASEADVARDHDLVRRGHTLGVLHPADRRANEFQASLFVLEGGERGSRDSAARHTMDMTLRPGEALVWRWTRRSPVRVHGVVPSRFPHVVANGSWEYRPDFSREGWRKGANAEGVRVAADGLAAEDGRIATITWAFQVPYVLVGGRLEVEGSGARFEASTDGKTWTAVTTDLDALFPPSGRATYAWTLRCRLEGAARLKRLAVLADLQMAPLALPEMVVGENRFVYTDASTARSVRLVHEWVERSTTRPPGAPGSAVSPPNGGRSAGTQIAFAWSAAPEPDGDPIADYHFQLSERKDFAYTLSSSFNRLTSKTGGGGEPRFALPRPGLLAPGVVYFWRVRAKDAHGAWGPWSEAWSFTAGGPAVPLDVRVDLDEARGAGILRWMANPAGTRPATYRVYGSDEKGFSVDDEKGTFVAETVQPEHQVLSRSGGSNRAHYRVVAVDAEGRWSADSDFADAPRPFLHHAPIAAKAGRELRIEVGSIRSLGDVKARNASKIESRHWDTERAVFSLSGGPAWLRIDPVTGVLAGTPPSPGPVKAVVTAVLEADEIRIDPKALVWGHDKSLGASVRKLGPATIEVQFAVEP